MTKQIISAVFGVFMLISCTKEVSDTSSGTFGADSTTTGLLKKQVLTYLPENFEASVFEYTYDNSSLLEAMDVTMKIKDAQGNITIKQENRKFFRDDDGRIIRVGDLTDTVFLLVEYESNSTHVKKVIDNIDQVYIEFVYNNAGKIERLNFYQRYPTATDAYQLISYHTQLYDANGNLTGKTFHQDDDNNGSFETPLKIFFTYDSNPNPCYHADDALTPENWALGSPNNTLRQINEYYGTVVRKDTINYVYTYDILGRPVTSKKDNLTEARYFYY